MSLQSWAEVRAVSRSRRCLTMFTQPTPFGTFPATFYERETGRVDFTFAADVSDGHGSEGQSH
jgi:hypothetical protein